MENRKATQRRAENRKLSPSDFAFLWEECVRSLYLVVPRGSNGGLCLPI
jgi:hypothetical protein